MLIDMAQKHNLTQVHKKPTRGDNILDLVMTSNPTLVKSSSNAPGISDHDMVITDFYTKTQYQKTKQRKFHIYKKANWKSLRKEYQVYQQASET